MLVSCNEEILFSKYTSVKPAWGIENFVSYKFDISDTTTPYDLFLKFRTNHKYEFSNLFLYTSLLYPSGKVEIDTLEYLMSRPDGSMLGHGNMSVKTHKLWYRGHIGDFFFSEPGNYQLTIRHATRKLGEVDPVKFLLGVLDVGFSIESAKK